MLIFPIKIFSWNKNKKLIKLSDEFQHHMIAS